MVYNVAYVAPVDESLHSVLALSLLSVGALFLAWFFVYEITTTDSATVRRSKSLCKEVLLGAVASAFLGFGTLFLLLWVGLSVSCASERGDKKNKNKNNATLKSVCWVTRVFFQSTPAARSHRIESRATRPLSAPRPPAPQA